MNDVTQVLMRFSFQTKQQMTLLTEMASYPLTVLWALQEAARETPDIPDIHQRQSLVIHVVGAEVAFECNEK